MEVLQAGSRVVHVVFSSLVPLHCKGLDVQLLSSMW